MEKRENEKNTCIQSLEMKRARTSEEETSSLLPDQHHVQNKKNSSQETGQQTREKDLSVHPSQETIFDSASHGLGMCMFGSFLVEQLRSRLLLLMMQLRISRDTDCEVVLLSLSLQALVIMGCFFLSCLSFFFSLHGIDNNFSEDSQPTKR